MRVEAGDKKRLPPGRDVTARSFLVLHPNPTLTLKCSGTLFVPVCLRRLAFLTQIASSCPSCMYACPNRNVGFSTPSLNLVLYCR